eukprot:Skav229241  [mRNA]  locus=scaffold2154:138662:141184:+ [translate_table: standard]
MVRCVPGPISKQWSRSESWLAVRFHKRKILRRANIAGAAWQLLTRRLNNAGWKFQRRSNVCRRADILSEGLQPVLRVIGLDHQDALQAQQHVYRRAWRRLQFETWMSASRHEASQMLGESSTVDFLKSFHAFEWELIRRTVAVGPAHRTVVLGAAVSDAWMAAQQDGEVKILKRPGKKLGAATDPKTFTILKIADASLIDDWNKQYPKARVNC